MKRVRNLVSILTAISVLGGIPCVAGKAGHAAPGSSLPAAGSGRFVDFTLQGPDGAAVSLGALIGKKPVLLLFWAAWCPNCHEEAPRINRIHEQGYVHVVAVNVKESPKKVKAAIRSLGIRYPVLMDPEGIVAESYKVPGIPLCIIIDRKGNIVYRSAALPARIEEVLE